MSLAIDVDRISDVLIADGWHKVDFENGVSTFMTDAYEFIQDQLVGSAPQPIGPTGASWREKGKWFFCPLLSIIAVKTK